MPTYCECCVEVLTSKNEYDGSGYCLSCVSRDPAVRAQAQQARRASEEELCPLLTERLHGNRTNATVSATRLSVGELATFVELCELAVDTAQTSRFAFADRSVSSMRASVRMMKQTLGDLRTIQNVQSFLAPLSMGAAA